MTKKRTKKRVKKGAVSLVPGKSITAGLNVGETIWYDGSPKSFVQTTVEYLKGWFR